MRLKLAIVNGNGPALITPKHFSLCSNPSFDIYNLRMAPLGHMVPVNPDDCVFDHDCQGSLCECINMLEAIDPDLIYVQDNGLYNVQIAPHIKIAFPDKPFIYEPYDTVSSIYSDPTLMQADGRSLEDVKFNVELERYLFSVADGIVHNDDGPQVQSLIQQTRVPDLQVQAYVDASDIHFTPAQSLHKPARLVWAGGVAPSNAPDQTRGENKLLPFFKQLVERGYYLDVYVALARDEEQLQQDYPDYIEYAASTAGFNIHPFMAREALIGKLSQEADFGLHVFPKPVADNGRLAMYQSSMASKVLTYLAAGLPLITAAHLEPIARYVSQNKVGIVAADMGKGELVSDIHHKIKVTDYAELKQHVNACQHRISIQYFIHQLETFLNNILASASTRRSNLYLHNTQGIQVGEYE